MKKHLFIRVAEYAYEHPEGFIYEDLIDNNIISWVVEEKIMQEHFNNAYFKIVHRAESTLDTMFLVIEQKQGFRDSKCILTMDAYFNYIDYLEFQAARKNSKQAMWTAIIAIVLSLLAIWVQITTSISTQIDKGQFDEIKALIQNIK